MIKTLIVDDEPNAIKVLSLLVGQHCPELQVIGSADNIEDAYRTIIENSPDLLFLDINMPKGNGLELLERIQHTETKTILTTAHHQFAIEALRLEALDYLLKPIAKDELISSVNRLNKKNTIETSKVGSLHDNSRITIKTIDGASVINLKEIQFIQSHKNYSVFHEGDNKIVSSKSLGDYEVLLKDLGFIRIHRSTIVQISHIKELKRGRNWMITLNSSHKLEVARNKHEEVALVLNMI